MVGARAAIASVLIAAVIAGGCTMSRGASRAGTGASLVVAGLGGVLLATAATADCDGQPADQCDMEFTGLAVGAGAIVLVIGLIGAVAFAAASEPAAPRTETPAIVAPTPVAPPAPDDPENLTVRARFAARQDQCPAVLRLAARVERASAAYYQEVFVSDPDIARCLAAPAAP